MILMYVLTSNCKFYFNLVFIDRETKITWKILPGYKYSYVANNNPGKLTYFTILIL